MVSNYLSLIRWPNVLLVFALQSLVWWGWIAPVLGRYGISTVLSATEAVLLAFVTVIMVAAGNVINDLYDIRVDAINNPERVLQTGSISSDSAINLYYGLLTLGGLLAGGLAWRVGHLSYIFIYVLFSMKLWYYSYALQRRPLTGNLLVALLSALFPWVFFLAEMPALNRLAAEDKQIVEHMLYVMLSFSGFAFLVSWARELVKDIEDMGGDKMGGYMTFPILAGVPRTVVFVRVLLGMTGIWVLVWAFLEEWGVGVAMTCVFAPAILYIGRRLGQCSSIPCFHQISLYLKGVMILGIIFLGLYVTQVMQ